jgi:predicted RNase H-like HicB family nuclease
MRANHCTYRISRSPNDDEYVATCVEFPSLSWLNEDQVEALQGIKQLVCEVLDDMRANGETLLEAAAANISLNRLASLELSG